MSIRDRLVDHLGPAPVTPGLAEPVEGIAEFLRDLHGSCIFLSASSRLRKYGRAGLSPGLLPPKAVRRGAAPGTGRPLGHGGHLLARQALLHPASEQESRSAEEDADRRPGGPARRWGSPARRGRPRGFGSRCIPGHPKRRQRLRSPPPSHHRLISIMAPATPTFMRTYCPQAR